VNALFSVRLYNHSRNDRDRFLITVADGPHDRQAVAKELIYSQVPEGWKITACEFICLTPEEVWKENA
jgi:hypothetical protein